LILRLATGGDDLSQLYMMLRVMHSETVSGTSPVDPAKLEAAIADVLKNGVVVVAEVDGDIVGSIGGVKTTNWWSSEKCLADMWYFVYKQHRNSNIAIKLIKSFMEIGKNAKVKVKLGHVYSGDGDRKDKFYERLGLVKAGSLYTEA
jgi:GNAT superfamily N-acetyltransferase|tara:strand:+ start:2056 stop:2496 length:441 start_codon:yes stop_codon:yes gene_type:complete